jgi:aspartate aminotransferase
MSESAERAEPPRSLPEAHINPNVRGVRQSPTVAINETCNRLLQRGERVFKLGLGQSPFPVPASVVEALQANAYRKDYLQVQGLEDLREAVADYHRRGHGLVCRAEDVLIGPGSKELMFLLQVAYCGDLVVPTPAWVSYAPQARIVGRKVCFLHASADSGWRVDPGQIEDLCRSDPGRPRILVLNYPSNPTGLTYSAGELEAIAGVARRFGVVILSDEIYGELHHRGQHVSVARFYPEGTILSSGLSKWAGAGGWRLGTFTFPSAMRWLLETMVAVASETYTSTSAPIQYASIKAFQGGLRIERYLWNVRRILRALCGALVERLSGAGIRIAAPAGAFYLFPDFSPLAPSLAEKGIAGSPALTQRLLEETGVAILPGSDFARPPAELTARLAYVDFDGTRALAAAETLPREAEIDALFLDTYCHNVLAAVDRIREWVDGARR